MITYLLNGALILWVLFDSVKQKKFHYTVSAVILLLYSVFAILQNNYDLVESSTAFGWIQKILLIILAVDLVIDSLKNHEKNRIAVAISAVMACVARFARSFIFTNYTERMQVPGADVPVIYEEFYRIYTMIEVVTRFALLVILFIMAFELGKRKNTPADR